MAQRNYLQIKQEVQDRYYLVGDGETTEGSEVEVFGDEEIGVYK